MTERKFDHGIKAPDSQTVTVLPPSPLCRSFCERNLKDTCVEKCAPEGKFKKFKMKDNPDLPKIYPEDMANIPWKMQVQILTVYINYLMGYGTRNDVLTPPDEF